MNTNDQTMESQKPKYYVYEIENKKKNKKWFEINETIQIISAIKKKMCPSNFELLSHDFPELVFTIRQYNNIRIYGMQHLKKKCRSKMHVNRTRLNITVANVKKCIKY